VHGHPIDLQYMGVRALIRRISRPSRGQVIGYVGSSGNSSYPHLHFEVNVDGTTIDPIPFPVSLR